MSFAQRVTGKNVVVQWIHSGGTATLSGDHTAFEVTLEQETADLTAGEDTVRGYKPTLKNMNMSLEVMYTGTAGTASMASVAEGTEGTLIWAPVGTAAGRPKWGVAAVVTNHSMTFPFDDAAKVSIEWLPQGGDLTFDGREDTW